MYDYNCDVKLIVGTETFKAHRSVLEQSSEYFSAMFGHDMLEKNNGVIELKEIRCGISTVVDDLVNKLLIKCDNACYGYKYFWKFFLFPYTLIWVSKIKSSLYHAV